MISIKKGERTIRETTADFEVFDKEANTIQTHSIRVLYYSPTTAELREDSEKLNALLRESKKNETVPTLFYSDWLVRQLHSLPDIVDADTGDPYPITSEFLDSLDAKNIGAIHQAIKDDINPKSKPGS